VTRQLLIGSRGSTLALAQTNEIVRALHELAPDVSCRVIPIKTKGDTLHDKEQSSVESKSVFTKEIEDALLAGEIQLAVHSLKDLTTDLPSGLTIAAVPPRAEHRDALVSRKKWRFEELPGGARVGTSSPRRRTQLLAARSDLMIEEMRGNVDTRLRKLDSGICDSIVLAGAGLVRLGLEKRITEFLSTKMMLPAIGQGALAVEAKINDPEIVNLVRRLEDKSTRRAVEAERAFARKLGANCHTPIAAYARVQPDGKLAIDGMVSSSDGRMLLRSQLVSDGSEPERVGENLADSLLNKGAQFVLEAA